MATDSLRLLYHLHGFPPYHTAGAERYALELLRWLRARGHQCELMLPPLAAGEPTLDGFTVHRRGPDRWVDRVYADVDVALVHLDETRYAVNAAIRNRTPLVHVLHNDRQLAHHHITNPDLVVPNSTFVAEAVPRGVRSVIVFPYCPPDRYRTELDPGDAILFVNPTVAKGAPLVFEVARRLPDRRFLIAGGAYGRQLTPPADLPNVELWRNVDDPRILYREARLVLVPSIYETFGRVPLEAAASGIPTIARPTPGLRQALGDAAKYAGQTFEPRFHHHLDDLAGEVLQRLTSDAEVDQWVDAVLAFDNRQRYAHYAAAARINSYAQAATTEAQLVHLEEHLLELAY